MGKNRIIFKFVVILWLVLAASPAMLQAQNNDGNDGRPKISEYMAKPFWLAEPQIPQVLILLERDWKMFYPAYNNLADLNGDGALDIGFNPEVTYIGYFDSNSCYQYDNQKSRFVRVGATSPQSQAEAEALAPVIIKTGKLKIPVSKHGVCKRTNDARYYGEGQWHGNWLNFATTGRMDAIRKVLYGGKRVIDDEKSTVLEAINLPPNSHNWGGELYSDDIWLDYGQSSPWYDIPSFTGFNRPSAGSMHLWSRSTFYRQTYAGSMTRSPAPLFRVAVNIPQSNWHWWYQTPTRVWDWIGDHAPGALPYDEMVVIGAPYATRVAILASTPYKVQNSVARNYQVQVQVCQPGNISPTEGCRAYGANYKPAGLLQEYGESNRMYFGLMTSSLEHYNIRQYQTSKRFRGGLIRHHIQPFTEYVDKNTGIVKKDGLIDTIDAFEVTGIDETPGKSMLYINGSQAGNPIGEMLFEALRYLPGENKTNSSLSLNPTAAFLPGTSANSQEIKLPPFVTNKRFLPFLDSWTNRPSLGGSEECPKLVILILSEIFPDHDKDDIDLIKPSFDKVPLLKSLSSSTVPLKFDMANYLNLITNVEKLDSATSNKNYFWPDERGLCLPRPLTSLNQITGHCPSEPSLEGSYSAAAVAYYAHTHNLSVLAGSDPSMDKEVNVDIYAVGFPGNFPDITFRVDDINSLTLMPITISNWRYYPYSSAVSTSNNKMKTLINFFIQYWNADKKGIPYDVKFSTNFEFNTFPAYIYGGGSNNMERDVFTTFNITLLTNKSTSTEYRNDFPVFINSGVLKTDRDKFMTDLAKYQYANGKIKDKNAFNNSTSQTYYFGLKRNPDMDIKALNIPIEGVAIETSAHGSGWGIGGQAGYTINGVRYQGAYLDVGYNGTDRILDTTRPAPQKLKELVPWGLGIPGEFPTVSKDALGYAIQMPKYFGRHDNYCSGHSSTDRAGGPHWHYHPPIIEDPLLTPAECPFTGYNNADPNGDVLKAYGFLPKADDVCGIKAAGYHSTDKTVGPYPGDSSARDITNMRLNTSLMRYIQVRSFLFDPKVQKAGKLPNPLWLAAKYGGFTEGPSGNGLPDIDDEWKRGGTGPDKDDPRNYFEVSNMSQLPQKLGEAFEAIYASVSSGTANASSINSILGGGISIQTQFMTEFEDSSPEKVKLNWTGAAYGLFVDKWGNLRADTNDNQKLNLVTNPAPEDLAIFKQMYPGRIFDSSTEGDLILHSVTDENSMAPPTFYLCRDPEGNNNDGQLLPQNEKPNPNVPPGADGYPPYSRCTKVATKDYFKDVKAVWNLAEKLSSLDNQGVDNRNLYTYFGSKPANGSTDWSQSPVDLTNYLFKLVSGAAPADLHALMGQKTPAETRDLIEYIRGKEFSKYRNRTARLPWDETKDNVWRLGDFINSKPVIVGSPQSNFQFLYNDQSYLSYWQDKAKRRQVAYVGSNDGILHAINLGFFGSLDDGLAGYTKNPDPNDLTTPNHELGKEMWGYIPTAVLPHLQWLADPTYQHSYYVDLKPYIVDIKDRLGNWRTIMIVGLRLGGRTIEVVNSPNPPQYSYSEFFALDVTDPERTPQLLWRFSDQHLGLSSAIPSVVRSGDNWYILLPSGPTSDVYVKASGLMVPAGDGGVTAYEGKSTQQARVFVLNALTGQLARKDPLIASEQNSFFNDTFLPLAANVEDGKSNSTDASWSHHVVYAGLTYADGKNKSRGAVYRIQMANENTGAPLAVTDWKLKRFFSTEMAVTGAVNSTFDPRGNLWVVFGTGRMWSKDDLTPCGLTNADVKKICGEKPEEYYFYGIKEPLNSKGYMTFAEVVPKKDGKGIVDLSGTVVYADGTLRKLDGTAAWAPSYDVLRRRMMGLGTGLNDPLYQGYKRRLEARNFLAKPPNSDVKFGINDKAVFEMVTTQPKIDGLPNGGSNTIFTSYQTSPNLCEPTGDSYLNVVDTYTGLPAPGYNLYQGFDAGVKGGSGSKAQVTGIKKAGKGMASEAWVIKTDKGTIYGNTSFNTNRNTVFVPSTISETSGLISWREILDMTEPAAGDGEALKMLYKDFLTITTP